MKKHSDSFSVKNKVVVITGGAGLLGREYAACLLSRGARVAIFDVLPAPALLVKAEAVYRRSGRRPLVISCDITEPAAVRRAIARVMGHYGRIDALVNNAAIDPKASGAAAKLQFSPYERYPLELWKAEFGVGLTGAFIVTQAVIPFMKKQRGGAIVNIGSIYGETAPDNRIYGSGRFKSIAYATVKGALPNFTRTLASYLAPFGIRANHMTLGGVRDGQDRKFIKQYEARTMLGRMARPDDFNGALIFLLSDASRYVTGANIVIDGGLSAW